MSIPLVVTRGFGNGSVVGTIKDVVTAGYNIGIPVIITPDCINQYTGIIDDTNTFATGFIGADTFQFQSKIVDYIQLEGNLCC